MLALGAFVGGARAGALCWMTSGNRSRNWRMPGVSAAPSLVNALATSCWKGVAAEIAPASG